MRYGKLFYPTCSGHAQAKSHKNEVVVTVKIIISIEINKWENGDLPMKEVYLSKASAINFFVINEDVSHNNKVLLQSPIYRIL